MAKRITHALILAAGRGSRLMPYTQKKPKCLVAVGDYPILRYQLQALESNGIKNVAIVTGYLGKMIERYARKNFPALNLSFIRNDKYAATNDILSFLLAKKFCVKEDFLQIDGDVLFNPAILKILLSTPPSISATCVRKAKCGREEMKVRIGENNLITAIGKDVSPAKADGEFMSISLFRKKFSKYLFPEMKKMIADIGLHAYSGDAMDKVIREKKAALYAVDITRYPAIEIDTPQDLKVAERKILPLMAKAF